MLDVCLHHSVAETDGRPGLRMRMKNLIASGELEGRLGPDGMYLIFKVGANLLKDHT